jgi:hypothetical protein
VVSKRKIRDSDSEKSKIEVFDYKGSNNEVYQEDDQVKLEYKIKK